MLPLLLCLAGCGDLVRARVYDHAVAGDLHDQPRRILVVDAFDVTFSPDLPARFGAAIAAALSRCGVASVVQGTDVLELRDPAALRERLRALDPDADLLVVPFRLHANVAAARDDVYLVRLWDRPQRRDLWRGLIRLEAASPVVADRSGAGALLATRLVGQLARDRVLTGCPMPAG